MYATRIGARHVPYAMARSTTIGLSGIYIAIYRARMTIERVTLIVFLIVCSGCAVAQTDPFITTIENAKKAVAPIVCLSENSSGVVNVTKIGGSAFLIADAGIFLTAAHVVKDFLPGSPLSECAAAAIYLPLDKMGNWA
jgi:hypothetical protein